MSFEIGFQDKSLATNRSKNAHPRWAFWLPVLLFVLFALSGCQMKIYSNLPEDQANEMVALLLGAGIDASKSTVDGKAFAVEANQDDFSRAITILKENGLPKPAFAQMGELFKKEGLVSTPSEEKVRFLYGTSQELSRTLSRIDGVLDARVHVVLPETKGVHDTAPKPSSASVFIRHQPEVDLRLLAPQIKLLVSKSIEGLEFDNVSLALIPAVPARIRMTEPMMSVLGLDVTSRSLHWLWISFVLPSVLLGCLLGWLGMRYQELWLPLLKKYFVIPGRRSKADSPTE